MKYTHHMKKRIAGEEKGVPVRLMHKSNLKAFCDQIGVPAPAEIARFESVSDIDLNGLPDRFVLKPAFASTAEGVMLLERDGSRYYDAMSKKYWSDDEIVQLQQRIFEKYSGVRNRVTLAEQRVDCSEGLAIPADYKFLGFQGEIGIIIRIDRTKDKLAMSYYDGNFVPIVDERVRFNSDIADRESKLPPADWRRLLNLARRVSVAVPTPCARIDLFSDANGPLLGEITLTPGSFYYAAGHTLTGAEDERLGLLWEQAEAQLSV